MELSERLLNLRKSFGKTQKELSVISGIPVVTYRYYESGRGKPSAENLKKLADAFRVPVDYLLGKTSLSPEQDLVSLAGDDLADLTDEQKALIISEITQFKKLNKKGR